MILLHRGVWRKMLTNIRKLLYAKVLKQKIKTYLSHITSTLFLESSTKNMASLVCGTRVTSGSLLINSTAGSRNIHIYGCCILTELIQTTYFVWATFNNKFCRWSLFSNMARIYPTVLYFRVINLQFLPFAINRQLNVFWEL